MAAERKSESKLAEATERTTATLEGLRARLRREAAPPPEETPDDLGRQLEEYFSASLTSEAPPPVGSTASNAALSVMGQIRERVIQAAVDRILSTWDEPGSESIKNEIVQRVVDKVLSSLPK